ncbi:MAG: hypothetical protein U0930_03500 [Pirellulales bacterium]
MVSSFFAIDWALPSTPTLGTATLPGASVDRLRKLRQRPMPLDSTMIDATGPEAWQSTIAFRRAGAYRLSVFG